MKTEDMPTGMLIGRILELTEDLMQVQEDAQEDVPANFAREEALIKEYLKAAKAELAKRKNG